MGRNLGFQVAVMGLFAFLVCSAEGRAFPDPVAPEPVFLSSLLAAEKQQASPPLRVADASVVPGTNAEAEGGPETDEEGIADPLEGLNRAFFEFNDKLYFWLLKPIATGYKAIVPEPARTGVRNFFHNLAFPVRFVNCLLQGKVEGAANEFAVFMVNSTFGLAGFLDVVPPEEGIKRHEEDLGQTLGSYGMGPGFYIHWPIFGPSSLRDTFGGIGDGFLDPINYLVPHTKYNVPTKAYYRVNDSSLRIGDYESLKKASLDPYIALRNAYFENRRSKIME